MSFEEFYRYSSVKSDENPSNSYLQLNEEHLNKNKQELLASIVISMSRPCRRLQKADFLPMGVRTVWLR